MAGKLADALKEHSVVIFNPRRDDWDSSWKQDPKQGTPFWEQVNWELDHIALSDIVVFYFDPKTKSPVTLMELGVCLAEGKDVIICCPKDYFRHGNVVITAGRYKKEVLETFPALLKALEAKLRG